MGRTAPVPNIPPIPGMCPSIAVLGGGGDGGGGSGSGDANGDGGGGNGSGNGDGANGDGRNAPGGNPTAGTEGHPVDAVTGRAWTFPILDLSLPGPVPLRFKRMYSSSSASRSTGFGFGWAHTFSWHIELRRTELRVRTNEGITVKFPDFAAGATVSDGAFGWRLERIGAHLLLDARDGLVRRFQQLDAKGLYRLLSVEDSNGNTIRLHYRGAALAGLVDSVGREVHFVTNASGDIIQIRLKNAAAQGAVHVAASYDYDEAGRLVRATDADGNIARYEYDDRNLLVRDTDRAGVSFFFRYDDDRRCVETWGSDRGLERDSSLAPSAVRSFLNDETTPLKGIYHRLLTYRGEYTEVVDATATRHYFGNAHGTVDKRVSGGSVASYVYDERGFLLQERNGAGEITSYQRDSRGFVVALTDPLGNTTSVRRDAAGRPIQIIDANGAVTVVERDSRGNVVRAVDPLGGVSSYRVDEQGLVLSATSPGGRTTRYTYDTHKNLTVVVEPGGQTHRFTYDFLGRRLAYTSPTGHATLYTYTPRGDLASVKRADGSVTYHRYDGEGSLLATIDPNGARTAWTYGGFRRVVERCDADGTTVKFRYGVDGELLEIENGRGELHRLERDASGRVTKETFFDGRTLAYRFDRAGRCIQRREAGEQTDNEFDGAGRLIRRALSDGTTEELVYDTVGALVRVARGGSQCLFERDLAGRIAREVQVSEAGSVTVEYTYDPDGFIVEKSSSLGHHLRIERDAAGTPVAYVADGHRIDVEVDQKGREVTRTLPGGGRITSVFDGVGRLTKRSACSPSSVSIESSYGYDPAGRLEGATTHAGRRLYGYDAAGRLAKLEDGSGARTGYSYDAAGDRRPDASEPSRAAISGGRVLRDGEDEIVYDDCGRITRKRSPDEEEWSYAWDGKGHLTEVRRPDRTRIAFSYDPLGRRISKSVFDPNKKLLKSTRFIWNGDTLLHEIRKDARRRGDPVVEVRTYLHADNTFTPLAHSVSPAGDTARWHHYVTSPAGAPVALVDDRGDPTAKISLTPWGALESGQASATPLRFAGQYADDETGLHYNRYRYYDPKAGRFASPDPIGLANGFNLYAYPTDPNGWVDPLGLNFTPLPMPADVAAARTAATAAAHPHQGAMDAALGSVRSQPGMENAGRGTGDCARLADAYAQQNGGQVITMSPTQNGPLQTWDGVAPRTAWPAHAAVEMPNGQIHDPDSGMVFPNRDAWARGHSSGPVRFGTSPPPPLPSSVPHNPDDFF